MMTRILWRSSLPTTADVFAPGSGSGREPQCHVVKIPNRCLPFVCFLKVLRPSLWCTRLLQSGLPAHALEGAQDDVREV